MCGHVCATVYKDKRKDNFQKLAFLLHHMGTLGSNSGQAWKQGPCSLSHLASPFTHPILRSKT